MFVFSVADRLCCGVLLFVLDRVIEEIGLRAMEESSVLMSVLLAFLRDSDSVVARQSIVSGTNVFVGVLEELTLQVALSSLCS